MLILQSQAVKNGSKHSGYIGNENFGRSQQVSVELIFSSAEMIGLPSLGDRGTCMLLPAKSHRQQLHE